jgi:tRNA threonylcarbamoyladenosine biosynthesis protein TsaE
MRSKYLTKNPSQTKNLGKILAEEALKTQPKGKALVIGLEGDLGGGKTTFLQGFAKGLGIKEKILSPTFIIMKKYELRSTKKQRNLHNFRLQTSYFYHIDCYRVKRPKEILDLGFKEIISNPKNIVAIEWSDRIRKILPKDALILKFEFINKTTREIVND